MLQTPQKYPRAGSQSYPSPAAEAAADGSTTVYFGPEQPEGVARGNWIQTDPEKGWFTHPPPLQPAAVVLRQELAAERNRGRELAAAAAQPQIAEHALPQRGWPEVLKKTSA